MNKIKHQTNLVAKAAGLSILVSMETTVSSSSRLHEWPMLMAVSSLSPGRLKDKRNKIVSF